MDNEKKMALVKWFMFPTLIFAGQTIFNHHTLLFRIVSIIVL